MIFELLRLDAQQLGRGGIDDEKKLVGSLLQLHGEGSAGPIEFVLRRSLLCDAWQTGQYWSIGPSCSRLCDQLAVAPMLFGQVRFDHG